ncbi:MAG: hypothetical protein ACREIT_08085 [Tepidisphaeraceae bacterium]
MADIVSPNPIPDAPGPKPVRSLPHHSWRDALTSENRWWRRMFSPENLGNFLKTLAWVGPLTLLIWVYAEREQLDAEPGLPFPVEVRSNDPNKIVTLLVPADKNVMAELTGPRAALDQLREILTGGLSPRGVQIEVPADLSPGLHERRTADLLSAQPIFRESGVAVSDCSPPVLKMYVDEVVEREARVVAPPEVLNLLEGPALFDPPTIRVRGPKSLIAQLDQRDEEGRTVVYADLAGFPAVRQPGTHDVSDVPLVRPIKDEHVNLSATKVHASLKVRASDVSFTIPSMPVFVIAPPNLIENHKVVIRDNNPSVASVTVTGPQAKIEMLAQDALVPKPKAVLEITRDDLTNPGEPRTRRLSYDLPQGLSVSPEDAKKEIEFRIVERAPGE